MQKDFFFMPVKMCYLWHLFADSSQEIRTDYMFCDRLPVTKRLKIQPKIGSFPRCVLRVDKKVVHPLI